MAVGSKEAALRALREAKASGGRKARTASPSPKEIIRAARRPAVDRLMDDLAQMGSASKSGERPSAVGKKAIGRPRGPERRPVLLELEPELLARVDEFQVKCNLASRMAAIRMLLERGLK